MNVKSTSTIFYTHRQEFAFEFFEKSAQPRFSIGYIIFFLSAIASSTPQKTFL
jgi:hypothetical protein